MHNQKVVKMLIFIIKSIFLYLRDCVIFLFDYEKFQKECDERLKAKLEKANEENRALERMYKKVSMELIDCKKMHES